MIQKNRATSERKNLEKVVHFIFEKIHYAQETMSGLSNSCLIFIQKLIKLSLN